MQKLADDARPAIDLDHELTKGFAHKFIRHKTKQLLGKYGYTGVDRDDLDQELKLRLMERFNAFDPEKSDWPAFVTTVVERQIATLIESRQRLKRAGEGDITSLSDYTYDEENEYVEIGEIMTHENSLSRVARRPETDLIDLQLDVQAVIEALPPDLRRVCDALQEGSIAEAARRLKMPRTSVNRLVCQIREFFVERGIQDFF